MFLTEIIYNNSIIYSWFQWEMCKISIKESHGILKSDYKICMLYEKQKVPTLLKIGVTYMWFIGALPPRYQELECKTVWP